MAEYKPDENFITCAECLQISTMFYKIRSGDFNLKNNPGIGRHQQLNENVLLAEIEKNLTLK